MKQLLLICILCLIWSPLSVSAATLGYHGGDTFTAKINLEVWSEQLDKPVKKFSYKVGDAGMKCGHKGTFVLWTHDFPKASEQAITEFLSLNLRTDDNFRLVFYSSRETLIHNYPPGLGRETMQHLFPQSVTLGDDESYRVILLSRTGGWEVREGQFYAVDMNTLDLPKLDLIFLF